MWMWRVKSSLILVWRVIKNLSLTSLTTVKFWLLLIHWLETMGLTVMTMSQSRQQLREWLFQRLAVVPAIGVTKWPWMSFWKLKTSRVFLVLIHVLWLRLSVNMVPWRRLWLNLETALSTCKINCVPLFCQPTILSRYRLRQPTQHLVLVKILFWLTLVWSTQSYVNSQNVIVMWWLFLMTSQLKKFSISIQMVWCYLMVQVTLKMCLMHLIWFVASKAKSQFLVFVWVTSCLVWRMVPRPTRWSLVTVDLTMRFVKLRLVVLISPAKTMVMPLTVTHFQSASW